MIDEFHPTLDQIVQKINEVTEQFYDRKNVPDRRSSLLIGEVLKDSMLLQADYDGTVRKLAKGSTRYFSEYTSMFSVVNISKQLLLIKKLLGRYTEDLEHEHCCLAYQVEANHLIFDACEKLFKHAFKNAHSFSLGGAEAFKKVDNAVKDMLNS